MDPFSTFIFNLPPIASIAIVAFAVTLFTSLVYKFVTDQAKMKILKTELKDLQNLMKSHRDNPQKLMEVQKQAMEKNMEYMRHSMRPTLFTMIPLILLFGWLNAHIAYYPLMPAEPFEVWATFDNDIQGIVELNIVPEGLEIINEQTQTIVNGEARFRLQGDEGEYTLQYTLNDAETAEQTILVTEDREYKPPVQQIRGSSFKTLNANNEKVQPLDFLGIKWSWIWSYILLSIGFSTVIRKLLKVH
jgi:uncharacterized membrane protein (DUF106 family)